MSIAIKLICILSIWNTVKCTWTSTSIDKYPYHVTVLRDNTFLCNGAIVAPLYVLTSATCAQTLNRKCNKKTCKDYINSGSSMYLSGGTKHDIVSVQIADGFNETTHENDLAVIKVNKAFKILHPKLILPEPKKIGELFENQEAEVTAWTVPLPRKKPRFQRFKVHVWADDKCQKSMKSDIYMPNMFCTQAEAQKCIDEMGAPIVSRDHVLLGIMTKSIAPCRPNNPRLYTKVVPYAERLKKLIKDEKNVRIADFDDWSRTVEEDDYDYDY